MKEKVWDNPNKMHFDSPHKAFNSQCIAISTGNQIGGIVYSNYIRSFSETECNGLTNPSGHLQDYDLTKNMVKLPSIIMVEVRYLTHDNGGIIYDFHHFNGNRKIEDGYVLTSKEYHLMKVWYINRNWRARAAVDEAIKYITN